MGKSASAPSNTGNVGHSSLATGVECSFCLAHRVGVVKAVAHRLLGVVQAALAARRVDRVLGRIARYVLVRSRTWQCKEVQKQPHAYEFGPAAE